jgi:hypothetical protein
VALFAQAQDAGPIHSVNSKRAAAWQQQQHGYMIYLARQMHNVLVHSRHCTHTQTQCRKMAHEAAGSYDVHRARSKFVEVPCNMRGGRPGGTGARNRRVLLVPVLWAGRGFSRIPRAFLGRTPDEGSSDGRRDLACESRRLLSSSRLLDSLRILSSRNAMSGTPLFRAPLAHHYCFTDDASQS